MKRAITTLLLSVSVLLAQQPRCQSRASAHPSELPIVNKLGQAAGFSPKLENADFVKAEATADQTVYIDDDWIFSAEAIPTAKSDLVVIGTVIDAQARLSTDQKAVITEYAIAPEKSVKGGNINLPKSLTVFRPGGRVRYSSGATVLYKFSGREYPRLGKRYVFFLKETVNGPYEILTAYLLAGCSKPLDGSKQQKFKRFDGMGESELLAIAGSGETSK